MFNDLSDLDWAEILLQDFDRARSLTVVLLLRYGEWGQLVNLNCDPSEYCDYDAENFRLDYQATELLRKVTGVPTGIDTYQAALDSFWAAEEQCRLTNNRLLPLICSLNGVNHYNQPVWLQEFVKVWKSEVYSILGPLPDTLDLKFSSGSTYDDRRFILPMDKMSSRPTVTADAYGVVEPFWRQTLWAQSLIEERPYSSQPRFIRGNRFTTVPKSAKTDRGICVEPSLNVTHQLSLGSVIRSRLRRVGIDLRYGQDLHRRLVARASLTKELATIDLSSASDTVSLQLVRLLLPPFWYELLDSLRSKETFIEGRWHRNAKFSSMGNGFTFELETLIFYTLCTTVAIHTGYEAKDISVYGDDIIVPTGMAAKVLETLQYFGFTPNKRKTFIGDVPFRESCGEDFFSGVPVRGYYLEKLPRDPIDWIGLANGLRRMARHDLSRYGDLNYFHRAWVRVLHHIPTSDRNFGPVHYGNLVIHNDDTTRWRTRVRAGIHELRVTYPVYADSEYSRVDRRCWTRGSIISAMCLGHLRGAGLIHLGKKVITPSFLKPRASACGWKHKWLVLRHNNALPAWACHRDFGN